MSKLSELTGLTTPALTDLFYVVQNLQEYKATGSQLLELLKTNIVVPITQDDYDDLTPAEKSNGCIYLITDSSLIDDTTTSLSSTWSSDKISGEIEAVSEFPITEKTSGIVTSTSGQFITVDTITLGVGTYILNATMSFDTNATGSRILLVDRTETSTNTEENSIAVTGRATIQKTRFVKCTAQTTFYIRGYQNSNSSLSLKSYTHAVKLN